MDPIVEALSGMGPWGVMMAIMCVVNGSLIAWLYKLYGDLKQAHRDRHDSDKEFSRWALTLQQQTHETLHWARELVERRVGR